MNDTAIKTMIIEDEAMARDFLAKTIKDIFPEIEIVAMTESVQDSIAWLNAPGNAADIIFMDVMLIDGSCFEIFRNTEINSHVIITTAFDRYALKAFEENCIDYLMKPIKAEALKRAIGRCRDSMCSTNLNNLLDALSAKNKKDYKERILTYDDGHIIPIGIPSVMCFISESKENYAITKEGRKQAIKETLDTMTSCIDPEKFFRISRGCIVSKDSIHSITKSLDGRLFITVGSPSGDSENGPMFNFTVSRSRAKEFLSWLEN